MGCIKLLRFPTVASESIVGDVMMTMMSTVMLMMLTTSVTTRMISSEPVWHRQGQCVEGALVLTKGRVGKASQAIHLDLHPLVGRSCFVSELFFS